MGMEGESVHRSQSSVFSLAVAVQYGMKWMDGLIYICTMHLQCTTMYVFIITQLDGRANVNIDNIMSLRVNQVWTT